MQASQADQILEAIGIDADEIAPSCAVAVFRGDAVEMVFPGFADIEARRRADGETLYYAGSLAKQFTALAAAQLLVAGRLALDEDIRRYLPEAPVRPAPITVEMLLHHTSGLPNYARLAPLAGYQRAGDLNRAETLRMLLAYPDGAFPPGASFEYSNGGYLLLSEIVARVSGLSFADYIRREVLDPLGMRRTRVLEGALPDDPNRAIGYAPSAGGFQVSEDVPVFGGAGAMVFTLNDLARYFEDITAGGRVWTPKIAAVMTRPGVYADGSPVILPVPGHIFGYAGGLMLSRAWVQHGGNFAGFQAWFGWLPGSGLGLAVLCNRGDVDPLQLATRIVAAIAPEVTGPDVERHELCGFSGRFLADALGSRAEIMETSDRRLSVTLTPQDEAPAATLFFTWESGSLFAQSPLTLAFDPDRRGFVLRNENVSARYRRIG